MKQSIRWLSVAAYTVNSVHVLDCCQSAATITSTATATD